MKYIYFVSYAALFGSEEIHGNIEINANKKIDDIENLRVIENRICVDNEADNVVILNFQLLRAEEEENE